MKGLHIVLEAGLVSKLDLIVIALAGYVYNFCRLLVIQEHISLSSKTKP